MFKLNVLRRNSLDFPLRFFSGLSSGIRGAVHLVGSFVPLRGVASFMADIGVPGAITLLELLTPTSGVGLTRTCCIYGFDIFVPIWMVTLTHVFREGRILWLLARTLYVHFARRHAVSTMEL